MALGPGARLGPYAIQAAIGAGGMGEVYRATDTNLGRQVAIKVLPDTFAHDPERLARFEREAKTLASLNHPNIAQIYGLEKADGIRALVMELVEGPTLADRIAQGPIPLDEALPIAKQIAEALEAAHEQSIIHRDLKPANIKVRADGTVKVLDFGLAKALEPISAMRVDATASPTITSPAMMTGVGVLLGTAAYMSPEQARGKTVDKRTDIWAFGCVVYEMLTGQRAIAGEDVTETLAAVVKTEPAWDAVPDNVSPSLRAFLRRCLQKNPKQRLQDIGDMRLALEGAFDAGEAQTVESVMGRNSPVWRRAVPLAVASLVTAVVVGLAAWRLLQPGEPRSVTRFNYDLPDGSFFRGVAYPVMAFSPDGRHFVYNMPDGLYLRSMGALEARLIPGTESPLGNPFLSPDGESVGYITPSGELRRIAISGGAPVVIFTAMLPFQGASWSRDNTILVGQPKGVMRVSANGGTPELVIKANEGEVMYGPQLLPDGDSVLFSVTTGTGATRWDQAQIVVQSLRTGERTVVLRGGSAAHYVSTGHLVYALGEALLAVAFDADRLEVSGGPVPVVQGLARASPLNEVGPAGANYGVSDSGTLVYLSGVPTPTVPLRTFVWVDRQGREVPLVAAPPRPYSYPRLSPDGTQVAVEIRALENDIWVWNITRATLTRLTFDPGFDRYPVWSPDGRQIAFSSQRDGSLGNAFWQAADGTGPVTRLTEQNGRQVFPTSFLPDGTGLLVFSNPGGAVGNDIGIVQLKAAGGVTPLLETTFVERNPEVSPDGRWLAYESDESGQLEVYVRPFPNLDGGRWQVSTGGGRQPLWARSGRELFYRSRDALMAVPVQTSASFAAGNPQLLFKGQDAETLGGRNYDVSPDGQRFLMLKEGPRGGSSQDGTPPARFIVVENWLEELKRLVPVN